MLKIQKFIYLAICLKLVSGYPPLENENVKIGESIDKNLDDKNTKEFNEFLKNTYVINSEHIITNFSMKTECNKTKESMLHNFTEHGNLVNTETVETTTIVNNMHKVKDYTDSASTEITTILNSSSEASTIENDSTQNPTKGINKDVVNNKEHPTISKTESDLNTGQTIKTQQSISDNINAINSAGVEILQNVSKICGTLLGKRISFGQPTTLLQYPWTALLLYNTKERYHCGGSLITDNYVLTAAHCVAQEFFELTAVRLGEHDITMEKDCAEDIVGDFICSNTIDVTVNKIIIHHEYSHLAHKNDIALLRLENKVEISRSYYPICLPQANENVSDKRQGTVAGWGATEKSIRSNVLIEAEVPILDISKCREVYRYTKFNDTTELCGSGVGEIDVCKGDSGGAIFYRTSGRKALYVQLGIISQGVRRCGDSRFLPAIFTKLPAYMKWIENNLEY